MTEEQEPEPSWEHEEVDVGDPLIPPYCRFDGEPWPCKAKLERDGGP